MISPQGFFLLTFQSGLASPSQTPSSSPTLHLRHDQRFDQADRRLQGDGHGLVQRLADVLFHASLPEASILSHHGLRAHGPDQLNHHDDWSLKEREKVEPNGNLLDVHVDANDRLIADVSAAITILASIPIEDSQHSFCLNQLDILMQLPL